MRYKKINPKEEGLKEKLKAALKEAETGQEVKRIQCVLWRIEKDWKPEQIAQLVGYNKEYVKQVQANFWAEGFDSFSPKAKGGRRRENMSLKEEAELINKFREEAGKGNLVEVSSIHKAYEEKLGRKADRSLIYNILERHNWRKISPRPVHPKRNKEAQEEFKKLQNVCRKLTN